MKFTKGESVRFLVAGSINTLATYLSYLALLGVTSYPIAFSVSFVAGIFIAYGLNTLYVFQVPLSRRKLFQYPLIYAFQYVAGMLLLAILVDGLGVDARFAPLVNVLLLTPVIFMLNKWLLVRKVTR
jgi:putative flippase GtrA